MFTRQLIQEVGDELAIYIGWEKLDMHKELWRGKLCGKRPVGTQ
jgi:hypothetical protein